MQHDMHSMHMPDHGMEGHSTHTGQHRPMSEQYEDTQGIINSSEVQFSNPHQLDLREGGHHATHHQASASHEHMMSMTFHGGCVETILFSWWNVTDIGEFVGSFLAIFMMALLYEGLKYYRKHLLWKTYAGLQYCAVSPPDKGVSNLCNPDEPQVIQPMPHVLERNVPRMMSGAHAWQTALHGLQVFVSYMLMLVFMTYNTWLCAAVVFGSATGYFLFGWRESVVVDFTEHCH